MFLFFETFTQPFCKQHFPAIVITKPMHVLYTGTCILKGKRIAYFEFQNGGFILRTFVKRNLLSKGISHPVFYGDLVYKLRRVKDTPNFISSGSKIVKRLRRRQYDPVIIERTIGLVLGPCTSLYRPFLKHCTLTNKAVGTI